MTHEKGIIASADRVASNATGVYVWATRLEEFLNKLQLALLPAAILDAAVEAGAKAALAAFLKAGAKEGTEEAALAVGWRTMLKSCAVQIGVTAGIMLITPVALQKMHVSPAKQKIIIAGLLLFQALGILRTRLKAAGSTATMVEEGQSIAKAARESQAAKAAEHEEIAERLKGVVDDTATEGTGVVLPDLTAVPSVRGGLFAKWFNDLTPDEFDKAWSNPELREQIEARLRFPGGMHKWNLVSRAPTFKRWGLTAEQIAEMRTAIPDVKFQNPVGWHGGRGSTTAHNEILDLIDSSKDFATFKQNLQTWASNRLQGGANALPPGLRPNGG